MEKPGSSFCKAVLGATVFWFAAAHAVTEPSHARQTLDGLRARIGALTTRLADELKRRDELSARLRDAELAIPAKRKAVEAIRTERQAVEKRRGRLTQDQARTQTRLAQQRAELARQLQAAYRIGREPQLKLLLNQGSPARSGRMLAYYGYFGRRKLAQIQSIEGDLARLEELAAQIRAETDKLAALDRSAHGELQALLAARNERGNALAALNLQMQSSNQQIARLKQQEAALDSLVADLNRVAPDYDLGPQRPFAQLKGRLPWPVPVDTARAPGSSGNAVRRSGLQIDAARGAKVRAPYFGRVVYADWLQGLGLLLIIEHGAGYLTLYGHAEVLYKNVGDSVAPGDIVAAMSETEATPLYFEIRQGKAPLSAQAWLKPRH